MTRITRLLQVGCAALVAACGTTASGTTADPGKPTTRVYYVAAEEVEWDYAPGSMNRITGKPIGERENIFIGAGPDRIGKVYRKSIFREYTDSTFTQLKERPPEWQHLGILGPLLRGAVGDTIVVQFRNNTTHPASMHPHGVFYAKSSEGAGSADGTNGGEQSDDAVAPGGHYRYVWSIPERAGPGHDEPSTALWMYHSHVDEELDVNAGLMGPLIVTRRNAAKADGSPNDVDRELVVAFYEFDENFSHHLNHNIDAYAPKPASVPRGDLFFWTPFGASNFKESMNGFLYGNLPGLSMHEGERVRWYLLASTNFEVHAPHWHGNTVTLNHMRTDVTSLTTMGMQVADMIPDNPGTWLFHCHVNVHLNSGMQAQYTVEPRVVN
jgi:FtsP/CotA-like multicopper oxidase with cupredoxin domain